MAQVRPVRHGEEQLALGREVEPQVFEPYEDTISIALPSALKRKMPLPIRPKRRSPSGPELLTLVEPPPE
ncbi:MAG: hypothetical protein IPK67_20635 [Planctomycetes bacterium]|nr:hypothetical protein [Planctomycetota bacterium]